MRYFILSFFIFIAACKGADKGISPIILKDASFIRIQLRVNPLSSDVIFAYVSFENRSTDSQFIYRLLLPEDGKTRTDLFSIFDTATLDNMEYKGYKAGNYLKLGADDDQGVIIPQMKRNNFIVMGPGQKLEYKINIAKYYDFSRLKGGEKLAIVYSECMPAISQTLKHIHERDSMDNKLKPVYYILRLPEHADFDSMRVYFSMPPL
ncbi:MAG: hypothetical protein ABIT05_15770 [Chitinophagaceae bacterium]